MSNLKQISKANFNFSANNSATLPVGLIDSNNNETFDTNVDPDGYETSLAPYFNYAVKAFECAGFERSNFSGENDRHYVQDKNGEKHYAYRTYRPNNFRYTNLPTSSDNRWRNGLIKWNFGFQVGRIANDTILDGDYVRSLSYANFGKPNYWDRRGASFGNHENEVSNLLFIDGAVNTFRVNSFLTNPNLIFGSSSSFSIENNSNNLGLFAANMAPAGSFWTVIED